MMRLCAMVISALLLAAYAQAPVHPLRIVLIVDSTEAIRQPIGTIRKALVEFVQDIVTTTEGFESTQNVNPQEIAHVTNHFVESSGTLHAIRLSTIINEAP